MGERGFETPNLGGDLWSMGFDVVLALDTHSSRKSNIGPNTVGISSTSPIGSGNVNISYGDMLFDDDLNEGDIAQITDLTNSLPKGDVESAQSFLAKIACQDLTRELNEAQITPHKSIEATLFNSVSDSDNANVNSAQKQCLQPVDVYGRVSLYEGKLILQLKHFNASTNYPINVSECWLCREKMANGSHIHSHKHALQGLFQVNDEFIQMDIDHYIIPDQALDPDPIDVNRSLASNAMLVNSNPSTLGHINGDRSLGLGEVIECSQALQNSHVDLGAIENSLHAPENTLISSRESLGTSKVNSELQYTEAELNNALTSAVSINSNSFINTFTSSNKIKMDHKYNIKMEHVPVTLVQTPNESVMMNHVVDTISHTSASTLQPSSLALSTCNSNENLIVSSCISVANNDNILNGNFITESHSTLNAINNIQELCTSSHEEQRTDSFIDHTTYEPNIGTKDDHLESYQNFFGNSYSYAYENSELSSQLPKIPSNSEQSLELSNPLCDSVIERSCSVPKLAEVKKVVVVGAKKRKSEAHKKPSKIRMREEKEVSEEIIFKTKTSILPSVYNKFEAINESIETVGANVVINGSKNCSKTALNGPTVEIGSNVSGSNISNLSSARVSLEEISFNITCPSCSLQFSRDKTSEFKDHIKIHNFDSSYLFVCPVCSKKIPGSVRYIRHLRKMHTGKRFYCTKCDANYSRTERLRYHTMKVHGNKRSFACDICPKTFGRPEYLTAHKNIHLGKKFECDVCHGLYSSPYNLHIHKSKSHSTEKLPHACHLCDKAYVRKDNLNQHIAKEHKNKRFKCDVCCKLFSRKDVLQRHKETHADKRISFTCEICNKKFRRKDSLKAHSYKHQEDRNDNIKPAPRIRKTKTKDMLMKFEKEHKEQCNICLKILPSNLKLEKHLQWHQSQLKLKAYFERETVKNYKCEICSKSFRTKDLIKKHILRVHNNNVVEELRPEFRRQESEHDNRKKFICEVCSKGFTRSSSLKSHLKTHLKMDTDDDEILAEIPTVLSASKNALKDKHFSDINIITSNTNPNSVLDGIAKDNTPNVSNLRLLLEGSLGTPNTSFGSNLSADLPNPPFCSSPNSPINLSTEAISAAAYLLTHPFYEGTYP